MNLKEWCFLFGPLSPPSCVFNLTSCLKCGQRLHPIVNVATVLVVFTFDFIVQVFLMKWIALIYSCRRSDTYVTQSFPLLSSFFSLLSLFPSVFLLYSEVR